MSRCVKIEDASMRAAPSISTSGLNVWYVIDWGGDLAPCTEGERLRVTWQVYEPGGGHDPHQHETMEQAYYMISGTGELWIADERFDAEPGMFFYIPPNVDHHIRNTGEGQLVHIIINVHLGDGEPPS